MGTTNKPPKYPTLKTTNENNEIKYSITTEEKVETLTKAIESIFTQQSDNEQFDEDYKIMVEETIANNKDKLQPLDKIPINYKTSNNNISKTTIIDTIKKLRPNKAPGPDKITNKILKYIINDLIEIIHNLFNICWFKGYYPDKWKNPISILINKVSKIASNPLNYRLIALINCIGKILEKIINNKLTIHVETNNIINPEKAGFR